MSGERALHPRTAAAARWVWLLAALALITLGLRLWALGDRQPHHDEMVHQWFSELLAFSGRYHASPAYHGPLLYHLQAFVLRVAGADLWQARLVPALAGLGAWGALVALAWREAGPRAAVAVALVAALSPSWTYYARFDGHDTLILASTTAVAWGRWHWSAGRTRAAVWLIVPALGLAWCTKLNALFVAGAIAAWPTVRWLIVLAAGSRDASSTLAPLRWPRWTTVAAALTVTAGLVALLFATTFVDARETRDVAEALLTTVKAATIDPVAYWSRLHQQQRLPGPFVYYLAMLALYEPLLLIGGVMAIAMAWRQRAHAVRAFALTVLAGVGVWLALRPVADVAMALLHVRPAHAALLVPLFLGLWRLAVVRAAAGDDAGVWWTWMAAAQTALYGYAGEKVPWLTVHVALPWMMVAGPALARAWPATPRAGRAGLAAAAVLTGYSAVAVVAWTGSDPAEPLVQLEYAPETHATLATLAEVCPTLPASPTPCVQTTADAAWPVQWYLRAVPGTAVGTRGLAAPATTPFIFGPARRALDQAAAVDFSATHVPHAVRFSMWGTWAEWMTQPRLADLARFWWRRRSLGPRRGVPYELWVRQDLVPLWTARSDTKAPATNATTTP